MKQVLNKWLERLQFALLFLALAVLVHSLIGWCHSWIEPTDPYKIPEGRSSKVFQASEDNKPDSPGDRLRLFYWIGE